MPRPATPLSVVLFVAFGLLLIAVLSAPIIPAIPLATFQGVNFGVFGFCTGDDCSSLEIGYDTNNIFENQDESSFDLPSSARSTLSALLIVHPVAALIVLIYFIMAVIAHVHGAAHSSRYLLCLFLVGLVGFLVSLLAFLVDVLLFVPHLAFGSYLVLASAILVSISGLVSCMMRRSMARRKNRRNIVKENDEMSGQNYYAQTSPQGPLPTGASESTMVQHPSATLLSGANGRSGSGGDSLPQFANFEGNPKKEDRSSDEHIPLTGAHTPSARSPNQPQSEVSAMNSTQNLNDSPGYDSPGRGPYGLPSRTNTGPGGPMQNQPPMQRDQYSNPMGGQPDGYGVRRGPSSERMNGRSGRGGPPPQGYRGRGGYGPPPPGRGGYGPNGYGGPGPGRGGYGPRGGNGGSQRGGGYGPPRSNTGGSGYGPPRGGGYGPSGMMRGGRTPPPPPNAPYQQDPYDKRGSPGDMYGGGQYQQGRRSPGTNLNNNYPPPTTMSRAVSGPPPLPSYQAYSPDRESALPRAESPPPLAEVADTPAMIGQAVEMDATPTPLNAPREAASGAIRDSDTDIDGMIALQGGVSADGPSNSRPQLSPQQQPQQEQQQQQQQQTSRVTSPEGTMRSTSQYSTDDQFIPARQNWSRSQNREDASTVSAGPAGRESVVQAPEPLAIRKAAVLPPTDFAADVDGDIPPGVAIADATSTPGSDYYEDVDPRFANDPDQNPPPLPTTTTTTTGLPTITTTPIDEPGPSLPMQTQPEFTMPPSTSGIMPPTTISIPQTLTPTPYEEIPSGARSPAESERSTFTSISQRGINPRWNGGPANPSITGQPVPPPSSSSYYQQQQPYYHHIQRRPVPHRGPPMPPPSKVGGPGQQDILSQLPDFQLLPQGGRKNNGTGGGTIPNSAYPTTGL